VAERNATVSKTGASNSFIGVNVGDIMSMTPTSLAMAQTSARLEAIAESGGICVSCTVYDQVGSRDIGS
jgi:class 3 adenylate cyclase